MRPIVILGVAVAMFGCAMPAHAEETPRERYDRPAERMRARARADSALTLKGDWQLWGHFGYWGVLSPSDVKSRYGGGGSFGASGDRRFDDRVALRARAEYCMISAGQASVVYDPGTLFPAITRPGWLVSAQGGIAVRPWKHLWLEGLAGSAYFRSGFRDGQTQLDPATGTAQPLKANSGWGGLWGGAARYEFILGRRDRYFGEVRFSHMDRDGVGLQFLDVLIGHRFF